MSIALSLLAFGLLVALLHRERANDSERRETLAAHGEQIARLDRSHRLQIDAMRAQMVAQDEASRAEREVLSERVLTAPAMQLAAVDAVMAARPKPDQHDDWEPVPVEGDLYIDDILDRVGAP